MKLHVVLSLSFALMVVGCSLQTPFSTSVTPLPPASIALPTAVLPTEEPATAIPTDTATPTLTLTPTRAPTRPVGVARLDTNIRGGPGITFPIVGQLKEGETFNLLGKSADALWVRLDRGWVMAVTVQIPGNAGLLPILTPLALPALPTLPALTP